jgi:hypothetical protein
MIKDTGSVPYIVWNSYLVETFGRAVAPGIFNEIIEGILEDCSYGIKNAAIYWLGEGDFKIIANESDVDLEYVAREELESIISEYELEDYL